MNIQNSAYGNTIREIEGDIDLSFLTKDKIQFKYGSANLAKFNKNYDESGWMGRKVQAVPNALLGIVKVVLKIAKVILIQAPLSPCYPGLNLKANTFEVIRDAQETFGWIATLISDRIGQYHIQESEFQRACYNQVANLRYSYYSSYTTKNGIVINDDAKKITLYKFKNSTTEDRLYWVKKFNLEISQSALDFMDYGDIDLLTELTLEDLIIPIQHSKLKYAQMNDSDFLALTIKNVEEANHDQLSLIKMRIKKIPHEFSGEPVEKKNLLLKDIAALSTSDIQNAIDDIPPITFFFLNEDQIKGLKLAAMQPDQITALFNLDDESLKARLALFSEQDVRESIIKHKLKNNVLRHIPKSYFSSIKLSDLNQEQLKILFSWKKNSADDAAIFKAFSVDDVRAAIEKNLLDDTYMLSLLSDEQLKGIQISKLSAKTLTFMFPWSENAAHHKKRFSNFQAAEVQLSIENELIKGQYQLSLISDEQLKALNLSKFSKTTLEGLFPWREDSSADRKRFANIQPDEIVKLINSDKLNDYQIKLISSDQLKGVDFSVLSQKVINQLFPLYSVKDLREIHSTYSEEFKVENGVVINDFKGRKCLYSEKEIQEMSDKQKIKNDDLLAKLTPEQRKDLEPRLYQHDPSTNSNLPPDFESFFENFFGHGFDSDFFNDPFWNNFNHKQENPLNQDEYYKALGLENTASKEEIKKAYKALTYKYHPDKNPQQAGEGDSDYQARKKECEDKFKAISEAFAMLMKTE